MPSLDLELVNRQLHTNSCSETKVSILTYYRFTVRVRFRVRVTVRVRNRVCGRNGSRLRSTITDYISTFMPRHVTRIKRFDVSRSRA